MRTKNKTSTLQNIIFIIQYYDMLISNKKSTDRIIKIDNIKGILIWLVVIGHFLLPIVDHKSSREMIEFFYLIYAFHMPAFMIASGYMCKRNNFMQVGKYLALYIVFKRILGFTEHLAYNMPSFYPDFFHESGAPWYLMCLVFYKTILIAIEFIEKQIIKIFKLDKKSSLYLSKEKIESLDMLKNRDENFGNSSYSYLLKSNTERGNAFKHNIGDLIKEFAFKPKQVRKILRWILFAVSLILSLSLGYIKNIGDFLAIDRIIAFAPFFFFGYAYQGPLLTGKTKDGIEKPEEASQSLLKIIFPLYIVFMFTLFFTQLNDFSLVVYGPWYNRTNFAELVNFPFIDAIARGLWIFFAGLVSLSFYAIVSKKRIPIITMSGKYSIVIYIVHRVIRDLCIYKGWLG